MSEVPARTRRENIEIKIRSDNAKLSGNICMGTRNNVFSALKNIQSINSLCMNEKLTEGEKTLVGIYLIKITIFIVKLQRVIS